MNANTNPPDSELFLELPCIELIMAMLGNAVEEIEQLCHPIPRLRQRSILFGERKNTFDELRWFLTSPDGAELVTTAAGINGILERYRRLAMPILRKAEALAKATSDEMVEVQRRNPTVALISAPETQVVQSKESEGENLYSSVDIIPIPRTPRITPKQPVRDMQNSQGIQREESYSSVDIFALSQPELFPEFFTSTPSVSL